MPESRSATKETPLAERTENGKDVRNLILLGLSPQERTKLFPALEYVRLKLNQVLHEVGEVVKSLYFLNSGLASVLSVQVGGETVEVGLIGKEGYVGLPVPFGFKTSSQRVVIQGDATGYRLDVSKYAKALLTCPTLERELQRFALILSMQSAQLVACNRLHDINARLARWLLMSHDRIGREVMPLTQEFLAQMLGTRRSSVNLAAGVLRRAGMISYTRGNVTLLNKEKLKRASCDCYQIIKDQAVKWSAEGSGHDRAS